MMAEMKLRHRVFLLAGFSVFMAADITSALAGFEWTPPAGAPSAPSSSASASSPPSSGGINWGAMQQMPSQKVQGIEAIPLTPAEKKKMPPATASKASTSASAPAASASADTISGFGSDLPLNVALQQVVPSQYTVSLADGVNGNAHVSWKGDRPWEQVLSDMLAPKKLIFAIQGDTLVVKSSTGSQPSFARATPKRSKADMIPDDMVSDNTGSEAQPPVTPNPISMIAHHKNPAPVQETEVTPVSAPVMAMAASAGASPIPEESSAAVIQPAWRAEKGQTLRQALQEWSKAANVKLYWSTDYDYKLSSDIAYGGSFQDAVGKIFDQFSAVKPQPYGQLYQNPETGGTLVVNTYCTYN